MHSDKVLGIGWTLGLVVECFCVILNVTWALVGSFNSYIYAVSDSSTENAGNMCRGKGLDTVFLASFI